MPLARRVLICATEDGLVLHPQPSKKDQRAGPSVKIRYGDHAILASSLSPDAAKPNTSFEAFGIVGLISVAKFSFLISITRRQQVATIRGHPIYVATEVALTPCATHDDASAAVGRTAQHLKRRPVRDATGGDDNDDDEDAEDASDSESDSASNLDDTEPALLPDDIGDENTLRVDKDTNATLGVDGPVLRNRKSSNSIAEDVISRRGSYGRFAQRWFSRSGWMQEQKRLMGLTGDGPPEEDAKTERASSVGRPKSSPAVPVISTPDRPATPTTIGDAASTENAIDSTPATPVEAAPSNAEDSAAVSLLPKLLHSTHMLFGASRAFYFSYDYDITRSVAKQVRMRWSDVPLHKLVDPLYFWNRHAIQPFIEAGADALVLPLMQGFIGQRSFVVDSHPPQTDEGAKDSVELSDFSYAMSSPPQATSVRTSAEVERRPSEQQFDITLISRRSVKRAGLRYLRRGVDEDGNVANTVETEQILSPSVVDEDPPAAAAALSAAAPIKIFSFVQLRGSIPLFFTQSPFSLKPVPVLQHSPESNFVALEKHFDGLRQQYGRLQIVNLVEKHGVEAALGTQYERSVQRLNEEAASSTASDPKKTIPFEWFDFHRACKGMKFETVSLLLNQLSSQLELFDSTIEEISAGDGSGGGSSGSGSGSVGSSEDAGVGVIVREQQGVLRTNCMDCLDRTNVCHSSFAKFMLDAQLKQQGFDTLLQRDQENAWFNTLWADNGDAISKQYASTAAMKGDYTRTRKRDYRGALTDAGLSLTRFFNGIVNDFFLQTTIDFLLGNVTDKIFDEFEANMMTKDPAMSMQKMREQAIDLCQRRVVADEAEELVGGWTLLAPHDADASLTAPPFEEVVLLLTDAALYLCRFDWNLDKLSSFERVELAHIDAITLGTYIVSTVSAMQTDEARNVGFVVTYQPGHDDILRINTRSLSSVRLGEIDGTAAATTTTAAAAAAAAGTAPNDALANLASFFGVRPAAAPPAKRIAFKALYADTSLATSAAVAANEHGAKLTEMQQAMSIAGEIERLVQLTRPVVAGTERKPLLVRGDIVSLAEARKSTGLLGHLGHSLKKLVWA